MLRLLNGKLGNPPPGSVAAKICGITNLTDALVSIDAGATALGFNFFPGSKRYLELEKEKPWLEKVPASVIRIAVLVNPSKDEALNLSKETFIDALQLHGDEPAAFCQEIQLASGKPVIKAICAGSAAMLAEAQRYLDFPVLIDAFDKDERGGTGRSFDWSLMTNFQHPLFILSGGLTASNVTSALRLTKAKSVDVASGVEDSPRKKNPEKIRQFLLAVQNSVFSG